MAQLVKNPPTVQETWLWSLGWEDSLEKGKASHSTILAWRILCNPMDYIVHGILQAKILEWMAFPFSRGSSQPRDWTQVSHIALPAEPQGKPENIGVSSLSLLQGIFLTQVLSRGLLHCRQILYQLSCQGNLLGGIKWSNMYKAVQKCEYFMYPMTVFCHKSFMIFTYVFVPLNNVYC